MAERSDRERGLKVYSHSRLWLFESCPEAYKVKYIDKKFPELPVSAEAFLGNIVHQSLEWLHSEVLEKRKVELDDLIDNYIKCWTSNVSPDLRLNNGHGIEAYFEKGIKFLINYYLKNTPFEDNTISIEEKILFPLDDGYYIQGYIDRIVLNKDGEYEVHDYKTNDFMKSQEQVDKDRQLAFYHLGINQLFGTQNRVKLVWHFLAHNRTIVSRRTPEQLEKLRKDTLELIRSIESSTSWPACGKKWCDWCDYKKKNGLSTWL